MNRPWNGLVRDEVVSALASALYSVTKGTATLPIAADDTAVALLRLLPYLDGARRDEIRKALAQIAGGAS